MKEITTSKGTFVFYEIPKNVRDIKIDSFGDLVFKFDEIGAPAQRRYYVDIDTQLEFLCTTDTITEDIAENIIGNLYNYFDTVLESFYAFLLYNNLDTNKNYAICKKK